MGAILYDALLLLALLFLTTLPFIARRAGNPVETEDNLLYQLSLSIVIYVFFVGFWSTSGRTLGMQSWGLRVETRHGKTPNLAIASLRFVTAILSWFPLGLGFFWQLWDKDKLTWHDRLSGTRLVHYAKPEHGG